MLRLAFTAICFVALPAHAGWRGAEWGMTPDEILTILPEEASVKEGEISLATQVAGVDLVAIYRFAKGKLWQISALVADGNDCRPVLALLESTYGTPG